jgi:predicted CoA-binding protein
MAVPEPIDAVAVFRDGEYLGEVVDDATAATPQLLP